MTEAQIEAMEDAADETKIEESGNVYIFFNFCLRFMGENLSRYNFFCVFMYVCCFSSGIVKFPPYIWTPRILSTFKTQKHLKYFYLLSM